MAPEPAHAPVADAARVAADLTRIQSERRPDHLALICEGRTTTHRELDRRASQVANGLLTVAPAAATRVALLDTNAESFFELFFGCAKANHILVPLNWRLTAAEITEIVLHSGAQVVVVGRDFRSMVAALCAIRPPVQVIALGGPLDGCRSYDEWREAHTAEDPRLPGDPTDVVLLHYTSGTGGDPKGVQLTNANILALAPTLIRMGGRWSDREVSLAVLPFFHVGGSLWGVVSLYSGATNVMLRQISASEMLDAIARYRVTKTLIVPAVIRLLLLTPGVRDADVSSLDLIIYGASPAPIGLLRDALATFKCGLGQVYGLTETSGAITYLAPEDHDLTNLKRLQSCGRPLADADIRVVDANGQDVPVGDVGEIVCRTPQLMKAYWNLPELTSAATAGGWFHTGDAGYFDTDGYLYIHDRIKDMIITGGENVYPAEVEAALLTHPAVSDAAVFAVPDADWGEAVRAIVVRKPQADVTDEALIAHLKGRIARYKVPKAVDFADALPRNGAGKVMKRVLREPFWAGLPRRVN